MIRLTASTSNAGAEIHVDGYLSAENLDELRCLIESSGAPNSVTLRLNGLQLMDRSAQAFLLERKSAGCRIVGCSLYVRQMLEENRHEE